MRLQKRGECGAIADGIYGGHHSTNGNQNYSSAATAPGRDRLQRANNLHEQATALYESGIIGTLAPVSAQLEASKPAPQVVNNP